MRHPAQASHSEVEANTVAYSTAVNPWSRCSVTFVGTARWVRYRPAPKWLRDGAEALILGMATEKRAGIVSPQEGQIRFYQRTRCSRSAASSSVSSVLQNAKRTWRAPSCGSLVEARAGHRRDADRLDSQAREGRVVVRSRAGDVGHARSRRPRGAVHRNPARSSAGEQQVAARRGSLPPASGSTRGRASPAPAATPSCSGAGAPTVRKSCTLRIAAVSVRRRDRPSPPASR